MLRERLKKLRANQGMSQETLARHLGLTQQTVANWESRGTEPDYATLARIADLFGVTADYLIGHDVPMPKDSRMTITLKDGRVVPIEELSPEDRRIVEELQAFIAAKLSRKDGQ